MSAGFGPNPYYDTRHHSARTPSPASHYQLLPDLLTTGLASTET
jgi:hypothetical protein